MTKNAAENTKASFKSVKVTKTVEVDENMVVLEITQAAAQAITSLLGKVGGESNSSMELSRVYYALERLGFKSELFALSRPADNLIEFKK